MNNPGGVTSRRYIVQMPKAEARYLTGAGVDWPATPEARAVHAVREWLAGVSRRRSRTVPVAKILGDLGPILARVPLADRPLSGPFASRAGGGPPLPGRVEYLSAGIVRLDDAALSSLAELTDGEDFRVVFTDAGPVLMVGSECYVAREEEQDSKPDSQPNGERLPPA